MIGRLQEAQQQGKESAEQLTQYKSQIAQLEVEKQRLEDEARMANMQATQLSHQMVELDESLDCADAKEAADLEANQQEQHREQQFNDVGLEAAEDVNYFVNPNDTSFNGCETGREIFTQEMLEDADAYEIEERDMLPAAMRPSEFGNLAATQPIVQAKFTEEEVANQVKEHLQKEKLAHDKMKGEYEKLYMEFVEKSI